MHATKTETPQIIYEPIGCRSDVTIGGIIHSAYHTSISGAAVLSLGRWTDNKLPHAALLAEKFRGQVHRHSPDRCTGNPDPGLMVVILPDQLAVSGDPIEDDDD
jgi:hypothetical protein